MRIVVTTIKIIGTRGVLGLLFAACKSIAYPRFLPARQAYFFQGRSLATNTRTGNAFRVHSPFYYNVTSSLFTFSIDPPEHRHERHVPPCSNQFQRATFDLLPRTSRTPSPKIAIFSQLYLSITQAKEVINLSLLDNFRRVISCRQVQTESEESSYTVLVTRYGPQSVASASI